MIESVTNTKPFETSTFRHPGNPTCSVTVVPTGLNLTWETGQWLQLDWHNQHAIRIRSGTTDRTLQASENATNLVMTQEITDQHGWQIATNGDQELALISADGYSLNVGADGAVAVHRDSTCLLQEQAGQRQFPRSPYEKVEDHFGVQTRFQLPENDALYGLGQFPDGIVNWRDQQATLIHGNISIAIPLIVSSQGWGILWHNASHTDFIDRSAGNEAGMQFTSEIADCLDYVLLLGGHFDAVTAAYRQLTGGNPLFPKAFYGFIQCKERYKTAEEMTSVVEESRQRELPLDVIVQDWLYWGRGMHRWSCMRHDPESYGDLAGAVQKIHDMHAQVMISIWPRIGQDSDLGKELASKNLLFEGNPKHQDKVYDAYNPEARAIYWRYVKDGLFDLDIDAWWMDGTEPEFEDCHETLRHKASAVRQRDTAAGSWARVLNAYSLATCQGVYENQRAETSEKRVFILTRSSFLGQQRNGAAVWSGDISATWRTFVHQIAAGLNFCATGQPYWTTDNGAFFVRGRGAAFPDGVDDPAFRELFLRWFQYSCFCPLMRSHGTQTPREIWQFGEPGEVIYDTLKAFAELRSRLMPYSYSLAAATTFDHATPMRPLGLVFPADRSGHNIGDQFMYGDAFMACPVTEPMVDLPSERLVPFAPGDLTDQQGRHGALSMRAGDGTSAPQQDEESQRVIQIDETWAGNKPAGTTVDEYSVRFSGQLRVPTNTADLLLRVAGQAALRINGETIVTETSHEALTEHHIAMQPYAGQQIEVDLHYYHENGDAVIQCGWQQQAPDTSTTVPQERQVYLPAAHAWFDFWTGEQFSGGQTITAPAPLNRMPVYVKAGSIVPLGPVQQYHDELPQAPWEIRIYPGADATYTIYEDAGNSYDYESGACSRIVLRWDDTKRQLHIDERQGSFPEMISEKSFHMVVVNQEAKTGIGIFESDQSTALVTYQGESTTIDLTLRNRREF